MKRILGNLLVSTFASIPSGFFLLFIMGITASHDPVRFMIIGLTPWWFFVTFLVFQYDKYVQNYQSPSSVENSKPEEAI